MRYASTFLTMLISALGAEAQSADVPYVAFVQVEDAVARSGPAKVHYATAKLERGAKVEVYRKDPGGWLAIRPPTGSFSLVPTKYVTIASKPGVARISEENVAALVGTTEATPDEFLWQVKLKQDEAVEVLGVQALDAASGGEKEAWYKIAPPAGEFRWIHEEFVTRDAEAAIASVEQPAPDPPSEPNDPSQHASAHASADGFVARKKRPADVANSDAVAISRRANDGATPPAAATATPRRTDQDDDLLAQTAQLDVDLSLMVAGDATTWRTSELMQRGETLLNKARTNLERGRARLLLNRIEEFHELEKRHQQIALAASPDDLEKMTKPDEPAALAIDDAAEIGSGLRDVLNQAPAPSLGPKFDGTGYLMPVHARRSDVPPFALVDKTGRIVQYVSPAPGLNLHRYRKLEVGVFGQRGFIPTLETPHVTAQRVIVLERNR